MDNLYNRIEELCRERNISITQMCREAGVPRANLTELKKGRQQSLGMTAIGKLSLYFNVDMGYFYGGPREAKEPATDPEEATENLIRFALFDGAEVSDEDFELVKNFARMVAERAKKRNE